MENVKTVEEQEYGYKPKINVFTISSSEFYRYALVMAASLFVNNRDVEIDLYVFTPGLSEDEKKRGEELSDRYGNKIIFIEVDSDIFPDMPHPLGGDRWGGKFVFVSMAPHLFLPDTIDKALYLESDLLIRGNVLHLYNVDLKDHILLACHGENKIYPELFVGKEDLIVRDDLNIKAFNQGVMLYNIRKLREDKFTEQHYTSLYAENKRAMDIFTQTMINNIYYGKVLFVDASIYNAGIPMALDPRFIFNDETPKIIHYFGLKPWDFHTNDVELFKQSYIDELLFRIETGKRHTVHYLTEEFYKLQAGEQQQFVDKVYSLFYYWWKYAEFSPYAVEIESNAKKRMKLFNEYFIPAFNLYRSKKKDYINLENRIRALGVRVPIMEYRGEQNWEGELTQFNIGNGDGGVVITPRGTNSGKWLRLPFERKLDAGIRYYYKIRYRLSTEAETFGFFLSAYGTKINEGLHEDGETSISTYKTAEGSFIPEKSLYTHLTITSTHLKGKDASLTIKSIKIWEGDDNA